MTLLCKSHDIWDGIVNPIYGYGVKISPDINPIYAGLDIYSGGLSKNLVKPYAYQLVNLVWSIRSLDHSSLGCVLSQNPLGLWTQQNREEEQGRNFTCQLNLSIQILYFKNIGGLFLDNIFNIVFTSGNNEQAKMTILSLWFETAFLKRLTTPIINPGIIYW